MTLTCRLLAKIAVLVLLVGLGLLLVGVLTKL
jgi:hypothetical protein